MAPSDSRIDAGPSRIRAVSVIGFEFSKPMLRDVYPIDEEKDQLKV